MFMTATMKSGPSERNVKDEVIGLRTHPRRHGITTGKEMMKNDNYGIWKDTEPFDWEEGPQDDYLNWFGTLHEEPLNKNLIGDEIERIGRGRHLGKSKGQFLKFDKVGDEGIILSSPH